MVTFRYLFTALFLFCGVTVGEAYCCTSVVLDNNQPLHQQFKKGNRVYVVEDAIDLKGEIINLPEKCTLLFNKGYLTNGTIVGNSTRLKGDVRCYTEISGTFTNKTMETKWFMSPKDTNRLCKVLNQLIKTNTQNIKINKGNYLASNKVLLKGNLKIEGEEDVVISLDRSLIDGPFCLFEVQGIKQKDGKNNCSIICISNICFMINGSCEKGRTSIFKFNNVSSVRIERCSFIDKVEQGTPISTYAWSMIEMYGCDNCLIDRCYTECVRLLGSYSGFHLIASNNTGYNSHGTWLECNDGSGNIYEKNRIIGNMLRKNSTLSQNAINGIIRNNIVEVNDVEAASLINLGHDSTELYSNSARGCIVEGNRLKTNISNGIVIWGNDANDITVRNNDIENLGPAWSILTLGPTSKNIIIENNNINIGEEGKRAIACHSEESIIRNNRISSLDKEEKYNPILVASYVKNSCRVYKNKKL